MSDPYFFKKPYDYIQLIKSEPFPIEDFLDSHGITHEIGPKEQKDQHGNYYLELFLEGPRANELEFLVTKANSEAVAIDRYQEVLLKFLGKNKHIIWRIKPEIQGILDTFSLREEWQFYSRLSAV